jgi:predicted phosphodiesterase
MQDIVKSDKTDIFFIGDIHGQLKSIKNWIQLNNLKDSILIFCGDFGLGFNSLGKEVQELNKSDSLCDEFGIVCYILRGNHDDPSYFTSDKLQLKHIKTVSDYTVIQTPNHNILCVGGAISIDRLYRKEAYNENIFRYSIQKNCTIAEAIESVRKIWWEDEAFNYDGTELECIKDNGIMIDVVATHSAPDFCNPMSKVPQDSHTAQDTTLIDDCTNERIDLARLYNNLVENGNVITHWFYGHFHNHYSDIINGTKFYGLDMGRDSFKHSRPGGNFDMVELR